MKIIRRVSKNNFTDFKDSQGLIDENNVIKLKQSCFFHQFKMTCVCILIIVSLKNLRVDLIYYK